MMTGNLPSVDVLLVTYNHAAFIGRALESIAFQDYGGTIRIVVADDNSRDETVDLIREFATSNPRFACKFLPTPNNLGITANYERSFAACTADYVAVLEGDDYWSSTRKLSKQIAFLQEHRECPACASNFYVVNSERFMHKLRVDRTEGYLVLAPQALIRDNLIGNFSTCVYRRSALGKLPKQLFKLKSYDWIVNICISMQGPIGYLGEPLSVYRQHSGGTWSNAPVPAKLREQLQLIPLYDDLTHGAFSQEFYELAKNLQAHPDLSGTTATLRGTRSAIGRAARAMSLITPPFLKWVLKGLLPPIVTSRIVRN